MIFTVDACVLRASSNNKVKPASDCRAVLLAISKAKGRVAACAALAGEWKKHASKFGVAWLAQVKSRGLLRLHSYDQGHENAVVAALDYLEGKDKSAAEKDIHLVLVALTAHAVVVSLERNSRNAFHLVSTRYAPLGQVIWLNPFRHEPYAVQFVEGGCGVFPEWRLVSAD